MAADLSGKATLVTGAARGLGRAIAELFLERGARVMLSDVNAEEVQSTASELGGEAHAVTCDVTDTEQVKAAIDATTSQLGGLDVLVNNAGIEIAKPVVEHSDEEFERLMAINVTGVFKCTKHAVPALSDGGGVIVNLASVAGLGGAPLLSAYCASKGAVIRFTEVCAIELRDAGIRVNAICPAFIDTAMVERLLPIYEQIVPVPIDELVKARQGRMGEAHEVAEVAAFLASEDAAFVTGSHYVLDGGLTAQVI